MMDMRSLSPKRQQLCSRENAVRVACRIFDGQRQRVSIVRTEDPLQPYRVSIGRADRHNVVAEMVA